FIRGFLEASPMLQQCVVNETADEIELKGRVLVSVGTSNFKAIRGRSILAASLDELAFWEASETSANPDGESLAAIRPAQATIPGAFLFCASSPYARKGELWKAYNRWFGKNDAKPLVWQASTRQMNATVPQDWIDQQLADDEAKNSAEYLAQFRADI